MVEKDNNAAKEIIKKDFEDIKKGIDKCNIHETMFAMSRTSSNITAFMNEGSIGAYDYENYNTLINENIKKFENKCSCYKK